MMDGKTQRSTSTWTPERRFQVGLACVLAVCVQFVPFYFAVWTPTPCQTFEREAQFDTHYLSSMVELHRSTSDSRSLPLTLEHLAEREYELTEDPWGNEYVYRYTRIDQPEFVVFSMGPDGIAGTEDDIFVEDDR